MNKVYYTRWAVSGGRKIKTKCPHGMSIQEKVIVVKSQACKGCDHYKGDGEVKFLYIECSHPVNSTKGR